MLWELKAAIYETRAGDVRNCFDYLYLGANPDQEVVTLLQRSYADGVQLEGNDVEVSLHLNAEDAAGLLWRW